MATTTPATPTNPEPDDEPIVATIDETGAVETVEPAREVAVVNEVQADEVHVAEPARPTPTAEPAPSAPNVVYVTVPAAPVKKGNRGIGALFVLLSSVVYATLLAIVFAIIWLSARGQLTISFNASFFIPVLFFALSFVLLVLVLNRAGWWTYVIGSVIVALVVYFGAAGSLLLLNGGLLETPEAASAIFRSVLANPLVIAAALLAREVVIWTGLLIAYRGRKVKARNTEARAAWDREQAERARAHA